ncbi:hypothetical protein Scep_025093 [Stephania cephalantha]|uniref:Fungal lipase-type domain-containing protein n=1 Tax=Stephania cephalantha TaxID=152367 RepID=A0AAP0F516_9MAGN
MNNNEERCRYEIVRPERGSIADVLRWMLLSDNHAADAFLESSTEYWSSSSSSSSSSDVVYDDDDDDDDDDDKRWVLMMSVIIRKLIGAMAKPMEWSGWVVEYFLNLLSLNGQLLGLLYNLIFSGKGFPHIQERHRSFGPKNRPLPQQHHHHQHPPADANADGHADGRLLDLCILASKLAYENPSFIANVVTHHWNMHFLDFFNSWNEFQKDWSTQVFLMCDTPIDPNFILVSFRGTDPFDAHDWTTDFDYSWYHIPNVGKLHMGFLEALGLGNRADPSTFSKHLLLIPPPPPIIHHNHEMITAYHSVRHRLKTLLLHQHKKAKFIVTGHSLGGALALLFPTILLVHHEYELMQRLQVVYTFGQPRVGDSELGRFMEPHLNYPIPRYFRLVYCNDLVPRIPYDNTTFFFKHFGKCLYFNSRYALHNVDEEPNRNYFGFRYLIPEYINAWWELLRAFAITYMYGEDYKETWCSIFLRLIGLAFPGVSAHSPTDYVNSVRLGS